MKKMIATSILLLASAAALSAEQRMLPMAWIDGVVKKVDVQGHKVTLKHGDIPNVMPAMIMSYPAVPALTHLHAGDRVRFMLEKSTDDYVITRIEAVK